MREKNPEMVAGEKKKIVMRPPQVLRAGARRTSFANFSEISRMWVLFENPLQNFSYYFGVFRHDLWLMAIKLLYIPCKLHDAKVCYKDSKILRFLNLTEMFSS